MHRFVPTILLALPLTLIACGGSEPAGGGELGKPEGGELGGPEGGTIDGAQGGTTDGTGQVALSDALTGGRPLDAGPTKPALRAAAPNRFDPGGEISDEELANYHVALTAAVAGKEVGTLTLELWSDRAPITVRNFLRLCDTGFYTSVPFHRIMRDFMVQGGDPTGTGTGDSPYGTIPAEFSDDPERDHGYGVISMARQGGDPDSASCQFFICCNEAPPVWALDGKYASFGRLTSGVAALEALADAPVAFDGQDMAAPTSPVTIVRTEVIEGEAPRGETIARPAPELGDEPPVVVFQHVLVSFQGAPRSPATRSREEAEQLVAEVLEQARAGADFNALVVAHSDAASAPDDETPSVYRVRNTDVRDLATERELFELQSEAQAALTALGEAVQRGELDQVAAKARQQEIYDQYGPSIGAIEERLGVTRAQLPTAVGDVVFTLGVGEIGVVDHDANASPMGWHVIKRLE